MYHGRKGNASIKVLRFRKIASDFVTGRGEYAMLELFTNEMSELLWQMRSRSPLAYSFVYKMKGNLH